MKFKLIALAAVLAAAGSANAAIDIGAQGNGDMFITMWDSANSYTRDLNVRIDAFQADLAAPGAFTSVFDFSTDAKFTSFMAGADQSTLQWNIAAADALSNRRVISTYSVLGAARINASDARSMILGIGSFATAVNTGIAAQGNTDSAVFAANTPGYANNATGIRFGTSFASATLGYNNTGSLANNSYASGLGLLRIDSAASGVANATYNPYLDSGNAARAFMSNGSLTITTVSAVPEPESFAMLLAGLGLMGAIARRRQNKA